MASYVVLAPAKDGKPRIKITAELGYDQFGRRIRRYKTVTLNSLAERTVTKAIRDFVIEVATKEQEQKLEFMTFQMFYEKWMEMHIKNNLSISTRDGYTSYFNGGILKTFGKMQMREITTLDIVNFFKKQKEEGKKSLLGKYTSMKNFFKTALKWGVIDSNPMLGVDRPVNGKRDKVLEFYDEKQLQDLLAVLDAAHPNHAISIKLAALVGLRMTEIAGIRMECINYNDNTILIDKTLKYDKETGRFLLGPTKTKRSRIVSVPKSLMDEIKAHELQQKKRRIALGSAWNPMLDENGKPVNLLITKSDGFPAYPGSMTNRFKEVLERFNLPKVTFHGLRHTYASYALSKGVNIKVIQEQLGHANIEETLNTYSHLTLKDKEKASDAFDHFL